MMAFGWAALAPGQGYLHKVEDTFLARPSEEQRLSERVAGVSLSLVPWSPSVRAQNLTTIVWHSVHACTFDF